ncbi:MAG: hypothetical protein ACTH2W_07400 [Vagococcus sp.]
MKRIEQQLGSGVSYIYCLFILTYFIIKATSLDSNNLFNITGKLSMLTVYVYLLFVIIITPKPLKVWVLFMVSFTLSLISSYITGNKDIILFFMFFFASFGVNFKKFIKVDFYTRLVCLIIVFLLNHINVIDNVILYRDGVVRQSLGFYHPNTLGLFIFSIFIDYVILRWKKINVLDILVIISTILFLYIYPNSLSTIVVLVISLIYIIFDKFIKIEKINKFLVFTPIIFTIISVYLAVMGNTLKLIILNYDKLFTGRLWYFRYLFENYGFTIYGEKILELDSTYAINRMFNVRYLDNSYLSLSIRYGVILLFVFMYILLSLGKKFVRNEQSEYVFMIVALSIYSFTENILFRPEFVVLCLMGSFYFTFKKELIKYDT